MWRLTKLWGTVPLWVWILSLIEMILAIWLARHWNDDKTSYDKKNKEAKKIITS